MGNSGQRQEKQLPAHGKDALKKKGAVETDVDESQRGRPPIDELSKLTDDKHPNPKSKQPEQQPDSKDTYDPTDEITPG